MSDRTEFDDLARRKLEEREFPFDPHAWTDLERQLDGLGTSGVSTGTKHRDRRWMLAGLMLLSTCGGVWYALQNDRSQAVAEQQRSAPMVTITPEAARVVQPTDMAPTTPATHTTPTSARGETPATVNSRPAPVTPSTPATQTTRPNGPMRTKAAAIDDPVITQPAVVSPNGRATEGGLLVNTPVATSPDTPVDDGQAPATGPVDPDIAAVVPDQEDPTSIAPPATGSDAPLGDEDPAPTAVTAPPISVGEPTNGPTLATDQGTEAPTSPSDSTHRALAQAADSTAIMSPVADTLRPGPMPYPHWEITGWAGLFNTTTHYSGARTDAWSANSTARQTTGFGLELMHMGEHFGIGSGLHFSSYAEQIDAGELADQRTQLVYVHELQSVDTSILVVNGTVWIDSVQYYVTYTQDTTFLVLVTTTDQETVTDVRRNALSRSNRTSYLEIPLLFDAHTRAGRWGFGIRGGPTLGILQGRRGVLPGAQGYTDLADEAFQELVLGWTAQAYVRYHLADAWTIGVGPTARGQLLNTLQGDALVRRSSAFGGQFSVSYLLR